MAMLCAYSVKLDKETGLFSALPHQGGYEGQNPLNMDPVPKGTPRRDFELYRVNILGSTDATLAQKGTSREAAVAWLQSRGEVTRIV